MTNLVATFLLLLSTVCGLANAQPLTKTYTLGSVAGSSDTELKSELSCVGLICTITNSATTSVLDVVIKLNWYGPGGETALAGVWPCFSSVCGWSWDNTGAMPWSQPSTTTVKGTADFTGTTGFTQYPCLGLVCSPPNGADFYQFVDQDFGIGFNREGFQLTQTQNSYASVARHEEDPEQVGIVVERPMVEFSSRAVPLGLTAEYIYSVSNLTDQSVLFDIPYLTWSGTVAGHSLSTMSILASHTLAALVRTRGEVLFEDGTRLAGTIELLTPVPEPVPGYLFAFGLAALACCRLRRRQVARTGATDGAIRRTISPAFGTA